MVLIFSVVSELVQSYSKPNNNRFVWHVSVHKLQTEGKLIGSVTVCIVEKIAISYEKDQKRFVSWVFL